MAGRLRVTGRTVRGGYPRKMSDKEFKKGDEVTWQSHGRTAEGTVEEKITADTHAAKRSVRASKDDPQYRVRSEKSGNDAVHKPDALKKKSS
jgi:Hypervirulence associated proteins TUDOR domain